MEGETYWKSVTSIHNQDSTKVCSKHGTRRGCTTSKRIIYFFWGLKQDPQILCRNRQRIRKIPLKSLISEGFWSEWGDLNTQPRHPKCRALPVEPHPVIHFFVIIPRRGGKSKFFLSVVIPVVKAVFIPLSTIEENPANAGVTRLCGVSPHPIPDTTTALPKQARYQLR